MTASVPDGAIGTTSSLDDAVGARPIAEGASGTASILESASGTVSVVESAIGTASIVESAIGTVSVVKGIEHWNWFWGLPAVWRGLAVATVMLGLAVVLVGLFPQYGARGARKARRHSLTTTFIGGVVAGLLLGAVGALWYGAARSDTVSMLARPLLFVLAGVAVVWTAIGVVALGEFLAGCVGRDDPVWGVVVATALVGCGAAYPALGVVVLVVGVLLGFGAGIRTNPFASTSTERVVPPDRKA